MIKFLFKSMWWVLFGGCWHKYSKWHEYKELYIQYRVCEKCQKIDWANRY